MRGISAAFRSQREQTPTTAAAHYTLAGFYTYHHRREELGDALKKAQRHLEKALAIQKVRRGGPHASTRRPATCMQVCMYVG